MTRYDDIFDVVFTIDHEVYPARYAMRFGYACGSGDPTPGHLVFATRDAFWKASEAWRDYPKSHRMQMEVAYEGDSRDNGVESIEFMDRD